MLLSLTAIYLSLAFSFQDNVSADFGDLGKLLLLGSAIAVLLAVAFTVVRMRVRENKPPVSPFISIKQKPTGNDK